MVTPSGGLKELKELLEKTGIRNRILELGVPIGMNMIV